jgi:small conductance mechanosensitive channel
VFFALTENTKLAFDAAGISIPYPQSDVHIYQAKG